MTSGTLSWKWRRRGRGSIHPPGAEAAGRDLFSAGALGVAVLILGFMLSRFRLAFDDFFLLQRAALFGFQPDDSLRVALAGLFELGRATGSAAWPFRVANGAATAALLFLAWRSFLQTGAHRRAALVSVAFIATIPGVFELVRWGAGFQQLAAMAIFFGILNAAGGFAAACAAGERKPALALAMLAAALGAAGVFVKYPTMAMVPVVASLWSALVARPACSPRQALALGGGIALGIGLPFSLAHLPERGGELGKVGTAALLPNVETMARRLEAPLVLLSLAVLAMWLARGILSERKPGRGTESRADIALDRRQHLGLAAAAVAASVPYLLNARYFAAYYVVVPAALLAPVAAGVLTRLSRGPLAQLAGLAVFSAAQVPHLREATRASIFNDVERRMREVASVTGHRPPAPRIALTVSCGDAAADQASREELAELLVATEGDAGFQWATGWSSARAETFPTLDAAVSSGGDALVLVYCRGEAIRVHEGKPAGDEPESGS